jgi:hypothetical protein
VDVIAQTGEAVLNSSFADLQQEFEEACTFLRAFTLGQRGFTQRDGVAGVKRLSGLCDRLKALFGDGPHAKDAAAVVSLGKGRILAAEARLALLRGRPE